MVMKPCLRNRKRIAWLVLDALDGPKAAALRAHLAGCEGCRTYWEEISKVTHGLASAQPDSSLQASESFHHGVAARLRAVGFSSPLEDLSGWLGGQMLNWRVAVPGVAVLVIALLAVVAPRYHLSPSKPSWPGAEFVSATNPETAPAPTIANYQLLAAQSLEKLSELLDRQGNQPLPPAPLYTASGVQAANAPF